MDVEGLTDVVIKNELASIREKGNLSLRSILNPLPVVHETSFRLEVLAKKTDRQVMLLQTSTGLRWTRR